MTNTSDIVMLDMDFIACMPDLCHAAWQVTSARYMSVECESAIISEVLAQLSEYMPSEDRYLLGIGNAFPFPKGEGQGLNRQNWIQP